MTKVPIGVLASGSGSNLQALLDADLGVGAIVVVVSNVPGARALERAQAAGVRAVLVDHRRYGDRAEFDREIVRELKASGVEWVVLAGFMRIVTSTLLDAFRDRVVNIHPALLPSFPGTKAQKQALEAGVGKSGCTVHLVDEGMDTGPILAQVEVPVFPDDTEASLGARILKEEHRLYPKVVRALADGGLVIDPKDRKNIRLPGFSTIEARGVSR